MSISLFRLTAFIAGAIVCVIAFFLTKPMLDVLHSFFSAATAPESTGWRTTVTVAGAIIYFTFGIGNYLGDKRADIYIFYAECRATNPNCGVGGTWWIKETGSSNYTVTKFGVPPNFSTGEGDFPVEGDFDGDGKYDITVLRQTNHTYYHLLSSNGQFAAQYWDGSSAAPPSSQTNLFEKPLESAGQKISFAALNKFIVNRNDDGTSTVKRAADYRRAEK